MIHEATNGNPSVVNYQIFVGAFSFLSLMYLFPSTCVERLRHKTITLVLDGLNTLFFFAGGVALAARLGVHSCGNQVSDNALWE